MASLRCFTSGSLGISAVAAALLLSACSGMGGMGESKGGATGAASSTGSATAGSTPPAVRVSGGMLTDPQGRTLYTFDKDVTGSGKSVCNGQCAVNWPPLLAQPGMSGMGEYSIVTRDDGTRQWAYRGKPLYRFAKDAQPGDRTGDNVGNVWRVARP